MACLMALPHQDTTSRRTNSVIPTHAAIVELTFEGQSQIHSSHSRRVCAVLRARSPGMKRVICALRQVRMLDAGVTNLPQRHGHNHCCLWTQRSIPEPGTMTPFRTETMHSALRRAKGGDTANSLEPTATFEDVVERCRCYDHQRDCRRIAIEQTQLRHVFEVHSIDCANQRWSEQDGCPS